MSALLLWIQKTGSSRFQDPVPQLAFILLCCVICYSVETLENYSEAVQGALVKHQAISPPFFPVCAG